MQALSESNREGSFRVELGLGSFAFVAHQERYSRK